VASGGIHDTPLSAISKFPENLGFISGIPPFTGLLIVISALIIVAKLTVRRLVFAGTTAPTLTTTGSL
jgi:hypothetical protein